MARVYRQKTRKERTCGKCRKTIEKGTEYLSFAPGFRSKPQTRCTACYPRQSELTTSKMSEVYAALEDAEDTINGQDFSIEDTEGVLNDAAGRIRDVAAEYQEASDAWAGGNGNEEFTERADQLEQAADDLEDFQLDNPDYDPDDEFEDEDAWREAQLDQLHNHVSSLDLP